VDERVKRSQAVLRDYIYKAFACSVGGFEQGFGVFLEDNWSGFSFHKERMVKKG